MSRTVTLEQLRQKGACADQARLFRAVFGERAEVTIESCVAVADIFDWNWAALYLLSAPARAGYYSVMKPHLTADGHAEILMSPEERQRFRAAKWAICYIGDER